MRLLFVALSLLTLAQVCAKQITDTVYTLQNDKIILTYNLRSDDASLSVDFVQPRIIPSAALTDECEGEISKLKVVVFDRLGDYGKVKWKGLSPSPFMVPAALGYSKSSDGYFILGESLPIEFSRSSDADVSISLPLQIAVWDKKNRYRIVTTSKRPLMIETKKAAARSYGKSSGSASETVTERVAVTTAEESDGDNDLITSALSSCSMIREMLELEAEVPFSQSLQQEMMNLRTLKNQIREPEVLDKINDVLLMCSSKERELKQAQNQSALAAQAQQQALAQQQQEEAEAKEKAAEEKQRQQEEKQQKRTLWMIIGGVILGVLGFIGNAVFKHFRDVSNQKNIMQMQESLTRQAEHEASRRSREILRNKAHQAVNKGRGKLRQSLSAQGAKSKAKSPSTDKASDNQSNNDKIRSI